MVQNDEPIFRAGTEMQTEKGHVDGGGRGSGRTGSDIYITATCKTDSQREAAADTGAPAGLSWPRGVWWEGERKAPEGGQACKHPLCSTALPATLSANYTPINNWSSKQIKRYIWLSCSSAANGKVIIFRLKVSNPCAWKSSIKHQLFCLLFNLSAIDLAKRGNTCHIFSRPLGYYLDRVGPLHCFLWLHAWKIVTHLSYCSGRGRGRVLNFPVVCASERKWLAA